MFKHLFKSLKNLSAHTEMVEKFNWDEERYLFVLNLLEQEMSKLDDRKATSYDEIENMLVDALLLREIDKEEVFILVEALRERL